MATWHKPLRGKSFRRSNSCDCRSKAELMDWNHSLKVEAIHGERFATHVEAWAQVFDYIEVDYNRDRLHSTLAYVSPEQFERAHAA